jgi:hypothetical protein
MYKKEHQTTFAFSIQKSLQPSIFSTKMDKFLILKIIFIFLMLHEHNCETLEITTTFDSEIIAKAETSSDVDCLIALKQILSIKSKILELHSQQEDFYGIIGGRKKVRPYTTEHCAHTKKIFNRNGEYLKSLCDVHEDIDYKSAEKYCMDHDMDLLIVENEDVYKGMSEFLVDFYGDVPEPWNHVAGLWVNGNRGGNDWLEEWNVIKNGSKLSRPNGLPLAEEKYHPGNCITLKKRNEYEGRNYDCEKTYWFICEYASAF